MYGKPMQPVGDRPIIQHLIDRLRKIKQLDAIVLAISDGPGQGVFIDYAKKNGLEYIVGSEKDVLGRLIQAGDHVGADIVLRNTTENPYLYWENVDDMIRSHIERSADLTVTQKLPLGSFLEIISLDALKKSHRHGEDRHRSEFCTMFIAENPQLFQVQSILPPEKLQRPDIRLTVDTPQDLRLVRAIWEALHKEGELISLEAIVDFLNANPELAKMNQGQDTLHLWR